MEELFRIISTKIDPGFKAKKILDFGCGPGRMLISFSQHAEEVYGMDISTEMLGEAKKNCKKSGINNVHFLLADNQLQSIAGQKFNLVHSYIVLQHLNTKRGEKLFQLLLKSIRDEGTGVLHITYSDPLPHRRALNFFRYKIPYLYILQRIIGNVLFKRELHFQPQMQMNAYNLNSIFARFAKKQHQGGFFNIYGSSRVPRTEPLF